VECKGAIIDHIH